MHKHAEKEALASPVRSHRGAGLKAQSSVRKMLQEDAYAHSCRSGVGKYCFVDQRDALPSLESEALASSTCLCLW